MLVISKVMVDECTIDIGCEIGLGLHHKSGYVFKRKKEKFKVKNVESEQENNDIHENFLQATFDTDGWESEATQREGETSTVKLELMTRDSELRWFRDKITQQDVEIQQLGKPSFCCAVEDDNLKMVNMVHTRVESYSKGEFDNKPLLCYAGEEDNLEMVKYLIKHGADMNGLDALEIQFVYHALQNKYMEMMECWVEDESFWIKFNNKPLICYAGEKDNSDIVKYVVEHGADPKTNSWFGKPLICYAGEKDNLDMVKYLVEHGADPKTNSWLWKEPIHYVVDVQNNNLEVVNLMQTVNESYAKGEDNSDSCGTFKRLKRYNRSLIKIRRGGSYTGTWRKRKSKFLNLQDFGSKRFRSSHGSVAFGAGTKSNKHKVEHGKDNHSWINNVEGGDATTTEMQKPKTSKHFGKCIIINNNKFPDDRQRILPNRDGSTQDLNQLCELFKKLNFDVIVKENLTAEEMLQCMEDMGRLDHSQYRYFLCCVLTHGNRGQLYGSDGATVDVGDLMDCVKEERCDSLAGKPKIFFLDTSEVPQLKTEAIADTKSDLVDTIANEEATNTPFIIPDVDDVLLYRSSTPRVGLHSIFITKLVGCIEKYYKQSDLLSIMIQVNEELCEELSEMGPDVQVPALLFTLRKKVYLSLVE